MKLNESIMKNLKEGGINMKLNESQKIIKYLNESSSDYEDIYWDVIQGKDVYVKLNVYVRMNEKDDSSDIYKIELSYDNERPEDYYNGYKKQDERFAKATKAFEEGKVFEFRGVKAENGKIDYNGFILFKCFGEEELIENLEFYRAKRINVRTIQSFEDEE